MAEIASENEGLHGYADKGKMARILDFARSMERIVNDASICLICDRLWWFINRAVYLLQDRTNYKPATEKLKNCVKKLLKNRKSHDILRT